MSNDNPYASPLTSGAAADSTFDTGIDELVPATRGRRFANFIIDGIVGRVFVLIAGFMLGLVSFAVGYSGWIENMSPLTDVILSTFLFLLYYFAQEALFGRTIGKLITGTVVINASGGRPSTGQVLGRTLARVIPFEAFSALGTPPAPWHDSLSKTRVVRVTRS